MKLVIDSNIIFAALIRDSSTRKIIKDLTADFFVISHNFIELQKYKEEIIRKSGLTEARIDILLEKISRNCILISDQDLTVVWNDAKTIMDSIDPDDTPFIAAALATGADIWSDDPHFQKQKNIKTWKTAELVKLL